MFGRHANGLVPPLPHNDAATSLVFSPDGLQLITAAHNVDPVVRVWGLERCGCPMPQFRHGNTVTFVQYSRDGRRVLTVNYFDGTAQVWEVATGQPLASVISKGGYGYSTFSPDGTRVLTLLQALKILSIQRIERRLELRTLPRLPFPIFSVPIGKQQIRTLLVSIAHRCMPPKLPWPGNERPRPEVVFLVFINQDQILARLPKSRGLGDSKPTKLSRHGIQPIHEISAHFVVKRTKTFLSLNRDEFRIRGTTINAIHWNIRIEEALADR